jgi:hypothetical protein
VLPSLTSNTDVISTKLAAQLIPTPNSPLALWIISAISLTRETVGRHLYDRTDENSNELFLLYNGLI